jgi:uncharacterized phage protein gp47/JayE
MSYLSLAQLTHVVTEEEALEASLQILTDLKFNARSWQTGSMQLTLVRLVSKVWATGSQAVADIAAGGYNDLAEKEWLELFSISHYQNQKKAAHATQGTGVLTAASNAPGPFTIGPEDLVAADTVNGYTYRNKTGGLLNAGAKLALMWEAESPGAQGDIANGTLTIMRTPLAGVTLNNPMPVGGTSWITRNGADAESKEALRIRNSSKWATIGSAGTPALAYVHFAAQAHASVRRVFVDDQNPRGPNTVDIYVAGDAGDLSPTVVQAVQDYLDGTIDGIGRKATGSNVLVKSAVRNDTPLRATIYITKQYNTAATQQAILDAIYAYFKVLPIGGTRVDLDQDGVIVFGEVLRAILSVPGVRNAIFSAPTGDVPVPKNEVIVAVPTFQYVGV